MLALGKMFLDSQAPAADACQADQKTRDYTRCIRADIEPVCCPITHHALTGFNNQPECQQTEGDLPIRAFSIEAREPKG